jgi:hypothetical protein
MAKGSRSWNRWRKDNQRRKKERLKRQAAARKAAKSA